MHIHRAVPLVGLGHKEPACPLGILISARLECFSDVHAGTVGARSLSS